MIRKDLNINKGEWLSDVIKEIPTNTILNKTMTGCGATTLEINAARHSIIIEPNVPVIVGKKAQHSFLFAVYEGTSKEDVKAYLAGEHDGYRKIITTPEGFDKKVLPAMYETDTPFSRIISSCSTSAKRPYRMWATAGIFTCPSRTFSSSRTRQWFRQRPLFRPTLVLQSKVLKCCVSSRLTITDSR